jgi:hypothetical protein
LSVSCAFFVRCYHLRHIDEAFPSTPNGDLDRTLSDAAFDLIVLRERGWSTRVRLPCIACSCRHSFVFVRWCIVIRIAQCSRHTAS